MPLFNLFQEAFYSLLDNIKCEKQAAMIKCSDTPAQARKTKRYKLCNLSELELHECDSQDLL
ncbi:hypothetical protein A7985_14715 [Pseudoalteromonas luteoviolacea]|uniref:Uncharacterized protein n=1 Tax=Pseudoalteromonas luteoviolacea TaxID=43657 RepID=A0A1C0TQ17_9GAMM|nr:hypothetical protein A7985_14715 [Pseudoalteromonas luteoviolacea]